MTEIVQKAASGFLSPKVLQVTGLILLVGSAIFWAVSGRQSALFCSAALTLIGVGSYADLITTLKKIATQTNGTPGTGTQDRAE